MAGNGKQSASRRTLSLPIKKVETIAQPNFEKIATDCNALSKQSSGTNYVKFTLWYEQDERKQRKAKFVLRLRN